MYGVENQAKGIIDSLLHAHPEYALNLMKQYLPNAWGSDGLKVESSLERQTYDVLVRDADDLINAINKVYIDIPEDEKYPESIEYSHEEKIARQFIWLHKYVVN